MDELIKAIRTGTAAAGVDPLADLPDGGVVTKDNVNNFLTPRSGRADQSRAPMGRRRPRSRSAVRQGLRQHAGPRRVSVGDPARLRACVRRRERGRQVDAGQDHRGRRPHGPGELVLRGEPGRVRVAREALEHGIALVAQELALVPQLTVAENVFLGAEPRRAGFVDRRALLARYERLRCRRGLRPARRIPGSAELPSRSSSRWRSCAHSPATRSSSSWTSRRRRCPARRRSSCTRSCALAAGGPDRDPGLAFPAARCSELVGHRHDPARRPRRPDRPAAEETEATLIAGMLGRSVGRTFPPKSAPAADAAWPRRARLFAPGVHGVSLEVRAARSWAWRDWSVPAVPSWRAPSSARRRVDRRARSPVAGRARAATPRAAIDAAWR